MNEVCDRMFPSGDTLIGIFAERTKKWASYFPERCDDVRSDNLIGKTIDLHHCNYYQWIREDEVHSKKCRDSKIARLKREIDASNLKRSYLVGQIDTCFVSKLKITQKDDWSNLYINSQTLGEIIDKLSVLCLKRFFTISKLKDAPLEFKNTDPRSVDRIEELIEYVKTCYDRFISHLKQGKGHMPLGQFKIYHSSSSTSGIESGGKP